MIPACMFGLTRHQYRGLQYIVLMILMGNLTRCKTLVKDHMVSLRWAPVVVLLSEPNIGIGYSDTD